MEIEYNELVETIFNKEPEIPKSITLDFVERLSLNELFEFLLTFFTDGCKKLYGELVNNKTTVDLSKLNEYRLNKIKSYVTMIGFRLYVDIEPCDESKNYKKLMYNNIHINHETKLSELKMILRNLNNVYIISFDFLR